MLCTANSVNAVCTNWTVSVPACTPIEVCEPKKKPWPKGCEAKQKQGNNPMTETQETRNYLTRRLRDINYNKSADITTLFGVYEDRAPKTYKELIDWIKKGNYRLDEKRVKFLEGTDDEDRAMYACGCFDGIIWTGRGEFDSEAYDKAQKERTKRHNDTQDAINVLSGEEGLKALKAFEDWMPKGPKN